MIFRTHYSSSNSQVRTIPKTFGGQVNVSPVFPIRPNEHYRVAERSGFYFDPRYANHIYVALNNVVFKTTNGGQQFDTLYSFPGANGLVYEMEISRSNPDVLYAVYNPKGGYWDPCEIWKSTNEGKSWTKTASPTGNNRRFRISIQPDSANKIWICVPRGSNGQKVFYSGNGGTTWTNKTTTVLNNEDLTDIYYQSGKNDMVYVTSQNGVFHWDKSTSNWVKYSTGLPLIAKTLQINPFYKEGELRLASTGRGIWARKMKDTAFAPVAQPITYSDSVFCSRDTVLFDCYSILKHQGASWNWTFSPAPNYISDSTARNPMVVFGNAGSYDVTLAIKDGNNRKSSKTIKNMVTVSDHCQPDSIPGYALDCKTKSGYASTPDLNLNQVDSFTISAWIMPRTLQNNWAAVVMNDGDAAGLNFYHSSRKPNLQLGYHWKGGQWWWSSGLTVDTLKWSHVALVATPGGITIYVNGESSHHAKSLSKLDITSIKIGSYKAWGSRNFDGLIDEVCLWDRALSKEEIREIRHLTRTGVQANTNGLQAYYQFNLVDQSVVMDKVGSKHASLTGAATKVLSTAPVGGGRSDRLTIGTSTNYHLPNTGSEVQFGPTTPGKEIVLTRINVAPDSLPNANPHSNAYWILNNYGTKNFSPVVSLKLKPHSGTPFKDPNNARLYLRNENEHLNTWTNSCGSSGYGGAKFNFPGSCSIRNAQQFFIQSLDTTAIVGQYVRSQVSLSACKKDSIYLEGQYRFVSGTYRDTFSLSRTKDSLVTTILTIKKDTRVTDVRASCDSLEWIDGKVYYSSNNSAQYILTNSVGCDSVIALDLIIGRDEITDTVNSCTSYTWINGVTYTKSNDTAKHYFTNQIGCDSIIKLDLRINSDFLVDSVTACSSHTWINGVIYVQNNDTAQVSFTNSKGCDSTITLALTINNVDNSVTQNDLELTSNQSAARYQWLDCENNYAELNGDTNQVYTATQNGRYAVKVEYNGCLDTSVCMDVQTVGISTTLNSNGMVLYPNPTNGKITLKLGSIHSKVELKQWDAAGKLVASKVFEQSDIVEFEMVGSSGNYILEVITNNRDKTRFNVVKN